MENKSVLLTAIGTILGASLCISTASAKSIGYGVDSSGSIVRSTYGCLHTSRWNMDRAVSGCGKMAMDSHADSDGDGIADSSDQCPGTPAGDKVGGTGCSMMMKDGDLDGDGILDSADQCPSTPAGVAVSANGCTLDSDGDGVADANDACSATAAHTTVDASGCAIPVTILKLHGVSFELNSSVLKGASHALLNETAASLISKGSSNVVVAGHTDSLGDANYNMTLSQRRADRVRAYLMSKGVSGSSLTAVGHGEEQPTADNSTREGRAQNRRVEIQLR